MAIGKGEARDDGGAADAGAGDGEDALIGPGAQYRGGAVDTGQADRLAECDAGDVCARTDIDRAAGCSAVDTGLQGSAAGAWKSNRRGGGQRGGHGLPGGERQQGKHQCGQQQGGSERGQATRHWSSNGRRGLILPALDTFRAIAYYKIRY